MIIMKKKEFLFLHAMRIKYLYALTAVAKWTEQLPLNQKVSSVILGKGTCLGCVLGTHLLVCERQRNNVYFMHQRFSPFLPYPSLKIDK